MLSKTMATALNGQVNVELQSAYQYLAMSAFFESTDLKGFAHWMRIQYQEERAHALKMYDFIHDRDGEVLLLPVAAPVTKWDSATATFAAALANERNNSAKIDELCELAMAEKDHASLAFLQWFVTEQVEEESVARDLLRKLEMVAESNAGLFMMDQELAARPMPPEAAAPTP
ncbi:MAG: ferritin [bacterium]|nr:ferritin [bacterium]